MMNRSVGLPWWLEMADTMVASLGVTYRPSALGICANWSVGAELSVRKWTHQEKMYFVSSSAVCIAPSPLVMMVRFGSCWATG